MLTPHACPPPLLPAPACAARALAHPHIITTYQHAVSEETVGEGRVHQQVRTARGTACGGGGARGGLPGPGRAACAAHHTTLSSPLHRCPPLASRRGSGRSVANPIAHASHPLITRPPSTPVLSTRSAGVDHPGVCQPYHPINGRAPPNHSPHRSPIQAQVWIIQEFANRGSLLDAIDRGLFRADLPGGGGGGGGGAAVNLPALVATMQEIAGGW